MDVRILLPAISYYFTELVLTIIKQGLYSLMLIIVILIFYVKI